MENVFRSVLPKLLCSSEHLSSHDVDIIYKAYTDSGREAFENQLMAEKSNRPFASLTLFTIGCDKEYWGKVHNEYVERNSKILSILKKIFSDYKSIGGETLCVYENFGALLSSDISIGCFSSGDIDLVVNKDEEQLVISVLNSNGFYLDKRRDHASVTRSIILPFYDSSALDGKGFWLNIMRKPVSRNFMLVQRKYSKRLNEICRNDTVFYRSTSIRLLGPTAMVYFNALHFACEHHYSASPGMSLCCDMDRVIRKREIDWVRMANWCREDDAGLRIRLALDVCTHFLKTPIPLDIFGSESKNYKMLRSRIISEDQKSLIPQIGKLARLRTELASDDIPVLCSLFSRIWRR